MTTTPRKFRRGPEHREEEISLIGGAGALPGAEHLEGPAKARPKRLQRATKPSFIEGFGAGSAFGEALYEEPKLRAPVGGESVLRSKEPIAKAPAVVEKVPDTKPKTKAPKGGYAFGRGGGAGVVPGREPVEPERIGRFIDPTQTYTLGAGGIGRQDVVGGQDYLDLQARKEKITGSLAYRFPTSSKAAAREEAKLDSITKQQVAIRTGIETGIKGRYEAKTTRGKETSAAGAVRAALEEKQRLRIAQEEQFKVTEARAGELTTAQIAESQARTLTARLGARPTTKEYEFAEEGALKLAQTEWDEEYARLSGAGKGAGAPSPSGVKVEF